MSNESHLSRRDMLATAACALLPAPALARDDFAIDWQGGEQTPEVAQCIAQQIGQVRALPISDGAMAFFAAQRISVDREQGTRTRAGPRGIFFQRDAIPPDNPVLLHELIHRWHADRLPGGMKNPTVLGFFAQANAGGLYPANAYMLTNPGEFFAMMASVVLHGRAARPPFLRENVRRKSPEVYAFIVREFGFREA